MNALMAQSQGYMGSLQQAQQARYAGENAATPPPASALEAIARQLEGLRTRLSSNADRIDRVISRATGGAQATPDMGSKPSQAGALGVISDYLGDIEQIANLIAIQCDKLDSIA